MDQPLGNPIATGRTADVYPWPDNQVLKLYHDWFPLPAIQYEQRISRAVHASGLPVPRVGEIVQVNGYNGLIYERLEGISMLAMFGRKPQLLLRLARRTAELHAEMHARPVEGDFPRLRDRLTWKIEQGKTLPAPVKERALSALAGLPDGQCLTHGDFHPGNILVTPNGERIIDWGEVAYGSPLADVARTWIIIEGAARSPQTRVPLEKAALRLFNRVYLARYFQLRPGSRDEMRSWLPVVAAARVHEGITEIEAWLIEQAGRA